MKNILYIKTYIFLFSLIVPFLVTIIFPILLIIKFELNIPIYYIIFIVPLTIILFNFSYNKLNEKVRNNN